MNISKLYNMWRLYLGFISFPRKQQIWATQKVMLFMSPELRVLLWFFSWQGFLHFLCPMEGKESSKQWKMHLPEFEHRKRGKSDRAWDQEGLNKGVPPAPASRWCLTDRQYTMRRPLFSSEHYASSLKKTQPLTHTEKVRRTEREYLPRV